MVSGNLHIRVGKFERKYTVIVKFAYVIAALMNAGPIYPANLKIEFKNDVLGIYEFFTKTA